MTKDVAPRAPVFELKVKLLPVFGARLPVVSVANNGKQVVSDDSSATVIADGTPEAESLYVITPVLLS